MTEKPTSARQKIAGLRANFVSQLPGRIAEARLHLERAAADPADRSASEALHRFLHSIKGTGRSFGFADLGAAAARGEAIASQLLEQTPPPAWRETLAACLDELERTSAPEKSGEAIMPDDSPAFSLESKTLTKTGNAGRVVYFCDDDPIQVEHLVAQLGCFGYEAVAFTDPAQLRAAIATRQPDALVMDILFPGGATDGIEIVTELRRELARETPTVFLSARDDFDARLKSVLAGGLAYFHKPIRALDLVAVLDELTAQRQPEPYRVLVVDDEPDIAGYHSLILENAGMVTFQVNEPARLLDALQTFRPDMVLMDMYMPVCTGENLAKVIRQLPEYVGVPIVYLSSETDKGKQFSAMRIGAEGFLTKPVVPDELVAAVAIRAERMRILRSLMARDSLTGLFNHTTTTQLLENAIDAARRQDHELCFAMIDIDHFKLVNDRHGHPAGDQVILALSRVLRQRLRKSDVVGRYGGEEFAVILQELSLDDAAQLLDELREDFSHVVFHSGEVEFSCTFSAGIAAFPRHACMEALREAADQALYRSKHGGRNRVTVDR